MALSITTRLFNSTDVGFGKAAVLEEIQVRVCRQFRVGNSVDNSDWTPAYGVPLGGDKSRWPPGGVRTENDNER
jgi:hypothetical protein